jgi:hypothetical protein
MIEVWRVKRAKSWLNQKGGVCSIGMVIDGGDLDAFHQSKMMLLCERGDKINVFSLIDRAGRIDEASAGLEAWESVGEDGGLNFGELVDIGGLQSPADIDAATDHAGIGTRHIEQDGIESSVKLFGRWLAPVVDGNFVGGDAEPCQVFLKAGDAFFVRVRASQTFAAAEGGGDEKGFSAGGGAGIEDLFARFGFEKFDAMAGGGVLDVEIAFGEKFGGDFLFQQKVFGSVIARRSWNFRIGRNERIEAEKRLGGSVVPLHDGDGFGFSERFAPAIVKPIGMRVEHGRRQVVEFFDQAFPRSDRLAQNGIDQRADTGFSRFDGFIHRGVVGDVENENLAETDA